MVLGRGGKIVVDKSSWPIVEVRPTGDYGLKDFLAYAEGVMADAAQDEPFALLVDYRHGRPPSATERHMITEAYKSLRKMRKPSLIALAAITPDARTRSVGVAIAWVEKPPFERQEFESRNAAMRWLWSKLEPSTVGSDGVAAKPRSI